MQKVRMDQLEQSLHMLKVLYNKYFSGLDAIEPIRERDSVKRELIEMGREPMPSSAAKFRFRQLKARSVTLDSWINRNLLQIERGTHPKMKFRADLAERRRREGLGRDPAAVTEADRARREEAALSKVVEAYMMARKRVGQSGDIDPEKVQERLRRQVREVKSRYRCKSVKLKVSIDNGKVKLTASPKQ